MSKRESIRDALQETPPAHHTHYGMAAEPKLKTLFQLFYLRKSI